MLVNSKGLQPQASQMRVAPPQRKMGQCSATYCDRKGRIRRSYTEPADRHREENRPEVADDPTHLPGDLLQRRTENLRYIPFRHLRVRIQVHESAGHRDDAEAEADASSS